MQWGCSKKKKKEREKQGQMGETVTAASSIISGYSLVNWSVDLRADTDWSGPTK